MKPHLLFSAQIDLIPLLARCAEQDPVVLLGNGVHALTHPAWASWINETLASKRLYASRDDLAWRGISAPAFLQVLDAAGVVALIAGSDSPVSWGGDA